MFGMYQGRFAPLYETSNNNAKRRKKRTHSDTSATRSPHPQASPTSASCTSMTSKAEFEDLDMNGKMSCLFDLMSKSVPLLAKMENINQTLYQNKAIYDVTEARLRLLEYKSLEMESRMLKTNLVFSGIQEPNYTDDIESEALSSVKTFLSEKMQIPQDSIGIISAFRAGRRRTVRGRRIPRIIIATFSNVRYVNAIMDNVRLLKGTHFGVSRDYPREIREARKELWPAFKEARTRYGPRNVKLVFPAALEIHGETVRNLFPGWKDVLQESRNSDVKARTELRLNAIVNATLQAANQSQSKAPMDIADESDECVVSAQGSDTDSVTDTEQIETADEPPTSNSAGNQQNPINPTMTEPGYLLDRHPIMTETSSGRVTSVASPIISPPGDQAIQPAQDVNEPGPSRAIDAAANEPV